jgi:hypothetical protein
MASAPRRRSRHASRAGSQVGGSVHRRNRHQRGGLRQRLQDGIRTVVPRVAPHERAGVLSLLFTGSYLGLGVPAVAAGILGSAAPASSELPSTTAPR